MRPFVRENGKGFKSYQRHQKIRIFMLGMFKISLQSNVQKDCQCQNCQKT